MFDNKTMCVTMILVGLMLMAFGVWVPDSVLPPVMNLIVGGFTVVVNAVRLGMLLNEEEEA